ncbi:MAG TPA: ammonium transporter [Kofleriaceae bacterium]
MHYRTLIPFVMLVALGVIGLLAPISIPAASGPPVNSGDTAWMLTAAGLVLLMTPGLSFFYGGMVRTKNVLSTMLQSFIAMAVISIIWVVVGFSLVFGDSIGGLIGNPTTYYMFRGVGGATNAALSPTIPLVLFALFQLKFAIITPALVSGAFAERIRFSSYIIFISLFTIVIYCPLAHATWHPDGLLHKWGVLDFAGGTVVHMSAGLAALAGAFVIGPRSDHKHRQHTPPANLPYVLLGTGLLWFGWFGFNAGSALSASPLASHAFMTTNTASASAMLSWMLFDKVRGLKPSALGSCTGAVVGLVAITPAAGYVSVGASIFIGVAASVMSNLVAYRKSKSALDDTLDVFPCHGVGGMFGMICTGLFANTTINANCTNGLMYGGTTLFLHHAVSLIAVTVLVFSISCLLYKVTNWISPLRVDAEQERIGLDISQHGESVAVEAHSGQLGHLEPALATDAHSDGETLEKQSVAWG